MGKRFHYLTNCVNSNDGPGITEMVDWAREIGWPTFRRHVPIEEVKALFPYYSYKGERFAPDGQPTAPMHLKDDWAVSFWSSKYRGRQCYYLVHSATEYIWTSR